MTSGDGFNPRQPQPSSTLAHLFWKWHLEPGLADYSGGPAPDLHRLPSSFAVGWMPNSVTCRPQSMLPPAADNPAHPISRHRGQGFST